MKETGLQHDIVMDFICRRKDGLGYREVKNTSVNNDLFIPSDLQEFIEDNSPKAWNNLKRQYQNDTDKLLSEIMEEIKSRIKETTNIAIFFNQNKTITFKGESIRLFYVSNTELTSNEDFHKNIFSAAEEVSFTYNHNGKKCFTVRPDVSFFVNGIFLCYMELKSNYNNQTAKDHGRGKVATDYLEAVKEYAKLADGNDVKQTLRREMLRIFERSIHLTASDINETYVLRNVAQFFDELKKGFTENTITVADYKPEILKVFKENPLSNKEMDETHRFEEVMRNLYSKEMIEKEILYYNFMQYEYEEVEEKNGKRRKKERKSNRGRLISPRPKQKFGCDKIMRRVQEFLEHENEQDYYLNKLRQELTDMNATPAMIEQVVAQRAAYCNNKYVYSLLLQYAAGFGKSNIIGWTALQLKDLRYDGAWAYDKILLVVDRLQLRDQLDTMMMNMNIDKSMFVEASDQKTFIKALTDKRRIIVVNIQKFLDVQDALTKAKKELKPMRVAFLIDEIHRSNSGESHEQMVSLFDVLQDSLDANAKENQGKKNLVIGFTATPSDKVLARFGEFHRGENYNPLWLPFDAYTMKEAIDDGYILDPTKHIIPISIKMKYDLPESEDYVPSILGDNDGVEDKYSIRKELIYQNEDRMHYIANMVVDRLLTVTYTKIHGTGKGMLAMSSIPLAIKILGFIRERMKERCELPRFKRFADAPVCIVYSDSQKYESSASLNNNVPEEKVIANFKSAKNGLIIVVDKLQTGFDEPKLHTLFLDKEIRDINAIQTISRVDRSCKGKTDCHIIDFSVDNVNLKNIKDAMKKYCGLTVSDFDPKEEGAALSKLYVTMMDHPLTRQWLKPFVDSKKKSQAEQNTFCLEMESAFRQWIKDAMETFEAEKLRVWSNPGAIPTMTKDPSKSLRDLLGEFYGIIELLDGVMDIEEKYKDKDLYDFCYRYYAIYRAEHPREPQGTDIDVEFDEGEFTSRLVKDESDRVVYVDPVDPESGEEGQDSTDNGKDKRERKKSIPKKGEIDWVKVIETMNEVEDMKDEELDFWKDVTSRFFYMMKGDEDFMAMIQDSKFERTEIDTAYRKQVNTFVRRNKSELVSKYMKEFAEHLFEKFIEQVFEEE
ncbi:MAG: type I restriction endonuclease subunit R [Bacteroidales bacterium]|nr:type I restriction endonuclease subunit R [Candidatus Liminaster caballi]